MANFDELHKANERLEAILVESGNAHIELPDYLKSKIDVVINKFDKLVEDKIPIDAPEWDKMVEDFLPIVNEFATFLENRKLH